MTGGLDTTGIATTRCDPAGMTSAQRVILFAVADLNIMSALETNRVGVVPTEVRTLLRTLLVAWASHYVSQLPPAAATAAADVLYVYARVMQMCVSDVLPAFFKTLEPTVAVPECTVCLTASATSQPEPGSKLPCGHVFHAGCICTWFHSCPRPGQPAFQCPNCRSAVDFTRTGCDPPAQL